MKSQVNQGYEEIMLAMSAMSIGGSVMAMKALCIGIVDSVYRLSIEDYGSVSCVGIGVRRF